MSDTETRSTIAHPDSGSAATEAVGDPGDAQSNATAAQERLVAALCRVLEQDAVAGPTRVLQTHISYVILTRGSAYKIKKAVNLGFLDFATLEARRYYCEQEVRLNRRFAPALYRGVVPITGSVDAPQIGGSGRALEYAVEMVEFPQDAILCSVLARHELSPQHIDALAATLAEFHGAVAVATPASGHGSPDRILNQALENFTEIRPLIGDDVQRDQLDTLERWTRSTHAAQHTIFDQRRRGGYVRECHGDLHLGNIVLLDGKVTLFDCIEFNDEFRWIDVLSEVAFTVMDLEDRGQAQLARRMLNAYLESTGDYAGLPVLRFYVVYRAMVRAKVAAMRAAQLPAGPARTAFAAECSGYLGLALRHALSDQRAVIITHGFSGSGKTTLSQALLEQIGAIRIRSDVERKRLHGMSAQARSLSPVGQGLYAPDSTLATYAALAERASSVVDSGYVAIVDATFLRRWQREMFRVLALRCGASFVIVSFKAPEDDLRHRIEARSHGGDASEADFAVLEHQLRTEEPLTVQETQHAVVLDTPPLLANARLRNTWEPVLRRLHGPQAAPERSPLHRTSEPSLESKRAFLSRPATYTGCKADIELVETHLSWIFLTDHEAYKLKKPVRTAFADWRTAAARGHNCSEEVRLNRRLTTGVYFGVVPLTLQETNSYALDGPGEVVDWLVRMRRLAPDRMLDRMIASGRLRAGDLERVIDTLCDFYRDATVAPCTGAGYCSRLANGIEAHRCELARFPSQLPQRMIQDIATQQLALLRDTTLFDDRARSNRIVEGHGDLRPEHICLESPPQIIDCLEFSRDLRTLDSVDELAFLALECERLGAPELKHVIFDRYSQRSGDAAPERLVDFYQSYRACTRAGLAIAHLDDAAVREPGRWSAKAQSYLDLALAHIEASH